MKRTYGITGVASGIGATLAATLKAQGHFIVGFDLSETKQNVDHFIALDLSDPDAITRAAAATPVALDGLCNNAGLPPREGLEVALLQVNFLGPRAFTHAMLPHLNAGASIVNMASRAGHRWRDSLEQVKRFAVLSNPAQLLDFIDAEGLDPTRCYDLSKEAMILWTVAMTEAFLARDMRINSVSPGAVSTGILDDFERAFGERMTRNVARTGRPGTPQEVADVAAYLLSPASQWIKGEDIAIDGGMGAFNMCDALGFDVLQGQGAH